MSQRPFSADPSLRRTPSPTLDAIETGVQVRPPKLVVYGVPGIGKTTFAASAPDAIVLPTEDGIGTLPVPRFPLLESFPHVMDALRLVSGEGSSYRTVVVDSLDRLEPLVWAEVEKTSGKRVEDHAYGKGYILASELWASFLRSLDYLRDERGMAVVLIAHSAVRAFNSPEHEPFDRYVMRLHKRAHDLVSDWADAVLFANYRVFTTTSEKGFQKTTRGVGNGERVLYTSERPAFLAKNRYGLPDELPLDWSAFAGAFAQAGGTPNPKNER